MPSQGFDERVLRALREIPPGLALACAIGLAAHLIAKLAFPYALAIGFEVPLAMLIGLVLANTGVAGGQTLRGSKVAVKYVLGFGIILLGLRLNLHAVAGIGSEAIGLVVMAMALTCGFAVVLGRRLRTERRIAILIGIGSSVCGASAIAATAPVVKANERELSFAIATITLFGTLAVFVFPLVGHALDLDVLTFGLWAGTAVGDTAQTIATSAAYDTVGRDVAVVVKLLRTVLLAPLLLLVAWSWSRTEDRSLGSAQAARRGIRNAVPFFVVGFVALAAIRTLGYVDAETVVDLEPLTRACFLVALAGLGLQTRFGDIRAAGPRPFVLALATWAVLASATLAAILAFGLGPARTEVAGNVDPRPLGVWTPVCMEGAEPTFAGAFLRLADRLPDQIGRPLSCAEFDEGNATTVQRTSEGVATFEQATGTVTFSNGERTWTLPGPADASGPAPAASPDDETAAQLTGRVLATGIPGAGALSPVGSFHPGGPMHDQSDFAATTEPGEILDPTRLLVASTSNFGAPTARADWASGSILSLATDDGPPLQVPSRFAASGDQASAADGATSLYTAQSPEFLNRVPHSDAETADMPAVSNPLGISINNAFGRPWFANAPGSRYAFTGAESVLDPNGRPLSEAPSEPAGGVFAGSITNREEQRQPGGLEFGAVGNAFLGASPDASGRAVFAVATADGALAQVHVEDGVDGLAPPGTIAPVNPGAGADDGVRRPGWAWPSTGSRTGSSTWRTPPTTRSSSSTSRTTTASSRSPRLVGSRAPTSRHRLTSLPPLRRWPTRRSRATPPSRAGRISTSRTEARARSSGCARMARSGLSPRSWCRGMGRSDPTS